MKWSWICFASLIHSIDVKMTKQNFNLNEFTFNVNTTINHEVPEKFHKKPFTIRFRNNALFEYEKFYITHKNTWWVEPHKTKSIHSCDIHIRVNPNPWMSSVKDYPLGYFICSIDNETEKTSWLYIS
jgi:hypothetical protein